MSRKHKAAAPELNFGRSEDYRMVGERTVDGAQIEHERTVKAQFAAVVAEITKTQQSEIGI